MMSNQPKQHRRYYSGEEKVAILHRHLVKKESISNLCEEHGLTPAVFYRWQKELFEKGGSVFQRSSSENKFFEKRIAALVTKLTQKNEVLAELMQEHIELKKTLGII